MTRSALNALYFINPNLAGLVESDLIGPGKAIESWAVPATGSEDAKKQYAVLLVGQLKALSDPFYRHLNSTAPIWLARQRMFNGTQDISTPTFIFPWSSTSSDDKNKAVATLGQLKAVFALRFDEDTDANTLPDFWEYSYLGQIGNNPSIDADGDGITNFQEAIAGTDPSSIDSDQDGMPDAWEILHQLNPKNPSDASGDADTDGTTNLEEFLAGTNPESTGTLPAGPALEKFDYDQADRLESVVSPTPESYTLDEEGNIQSAQ